MKKTFKYATIVLLIAISFLFASPPPHSKGPDKDCPVNYIRLNNFTGFSMNCDAIEYIGASVNPGYLFQQNYKRQSRPLYLLAGSLAGYSIYYLSYPFHKAINKKASVYFHNDLPQNKVSLYLSHYAGLVLINLIILIISLLLFEKILHHFTGSWKNGVWLNIILLILLISNHVTKTFFWTPHQQMFNTLLPLLCIWLFSSILKNNYSISKLCFASLLYGILLLFYGSFLLLLPIMIIAILYKHKIILNQSIFHTIKQLALPVIIFCLPVITWIIILKLTGVNFYSWEINYFREFVWITDAMKSSDRNLPRELIQNLSIYIKTFAISFFPISFLAITYVLYKAKPANHLSNKSKHLNVVFISVGVIIFIFFWLMGYYTDRLTYTINPVLICYAAILLNDIKLRRTKIMIIVLLILCWHIFILLNETPHFTNRFYY